MSSKGKSSIVCSAIGERHTTHLQLSSIFVSLLNLGTATREEVMYDAAAAILLNSKKGTKTKVAMELAGFTDVELKIDIHRKRIERLRDRKARAAANIERLPLSVITISSDHAQSDLTENDSASNKSNGSRASAAMKSQGVRRRRTSKQLWAHNAAKVKARKAQEDVFKMAATKWAEVAKLKRRDRVSAASIATKFNSLHGTNINERSIRRAVKAGDYQLYTNGRGRPSKLHKPIEEALASSMLTFIQLENAAMSKMPDRKTLIRKLRECMAGGNYIYKRIDHLYDRLMLLIADKIVVTSNDFRMEQRRLEWTTHQNINIWFETLKRFFINRGFAREKTDGDDCEGELIYFEGQTNRILNLDESEVSTDGTTKLSGGRPVSKISSTDSSIPKGATTSNKSGYSATFIGGSTVSGWPLPVHIQSKSEAQVENQKININFFKYAHGVKGVYGYGEVTEVGMTIGANPKAGMDAIEFAKYLNATVLPLYPDASDIQGKRVAIIVDSGPDRVNTVMLAELRLKGFYLIPGVPNTTHVTQATDRNYGPFKTKYRNNLGKLTEHRVKFKVPIQPCDIPLLIFGGEDAASGVLLENAFQGAFGYDCNVKVWAEIGLQPFDRNCLRDNKVKHEIVISSDGTIDIDADPLAQKLAGIECLNKTATDLLLMHGYDSKVFKKCAPRSEAMTRQIAVTVPLSRERQDLLMNAATAGSRFYATGGEYLNSDDYFISQERKQRSTKIKELKTKKQDFEDKVKGNQDAQRVIQDFQEKKNKDAFNDQDAQALLVSDLKVLYKWKHGKNPKAGQNKLALLTDWIMSKDSPQDTQEYVWTAEEEEELNQLTSQAIDINDTELGRQTKKVFNDTISVLPKMTPSQLQELKEALETRDIVNV